MVSFENFYYVTLPIIKNIKLFIASIKIILFSIEVRIKIIVIIDYLTNKFLILFSRICNLIGLIKRIIFLSVKNWS